MTDTADMTRRTVLEEDADGAVGASSLPAIHPVVSTPDLRRLRAFYEKVLGATRTTRVPATGRLFYVELGIGRTALGLVQKKGTETGEPVRVILSADVPDVDALLPVVESAGGTVRDRPQDMPWGQRVAHVLDPDGNLLNLTTHLKDQGEKS